MARRETEAERLRRLRVTFERSMRDRVSMSEAERRIALDQIAETRLRIEALRASRHAQQPNPQFFWQKGDLA